MKKEKYIVVGSGPAGIGVSLGLEKDYLVLESENTVGGFSTTIEINGAIFDYGGHSFHTPHPEVKDMVFNSLEMFEQKRNAQCYSDGDFIPYPFQKNFKSLSNKLIVDECEQGLELLERNSENASNFEEFIEKRFGAGIAKHFMLPYNRKLWGRDLRRLAADWTNERVAAPAGTNEKFDTTGGLRKPLQSDTNVAYPAKGGFGEIFKALSRKLTNVQLNQRVVKIDPKSKTVVSMDGTIYGYDYLVSTLPVTEIVNIIEGLPIEMIKMTKKLDYLSLQLGLIVVNHAVDTDIQRIYSAEEIIPAHKTAINHNSSDYLRKLPKHGIMMEISEGPEKILSRSNIKQWISDSLIQLKLIKSTKEIDQIVLKHAKYAYPVPTHDRDEIVRKIQDWLNENCIYSVGRFGQWAYINSDEALARGLFLGKQLRTL